jgi:hypothetical protein
VTQGTGGTDPRERIPLDRAFQSHDRVAPEEFNRRSGAVEVGAGKESLWELGSIDFQPHAKCCRRIHGTSDDFMHAERVRPERFVSEGVVSEDVLPFRERGIRGRFDDLVQPPAVVDEPASALDPISTAKIEETIFELKLLTQSERKKCENRGGSGVITLTKNPSGVWIGHRDIVLGLNIPNYPLP